MKGKFLAIDTSTPACSVALAIDDEISQEINLEARQHTQSVLQLTDNLLKNKGLSVFDLDGIICSAGPGAFTGLRVGAAVAMGLASAKPCKLLGISSLALVGATANAKFPAKKILTVLDARMGEFYFGSYSNNKNLAPDILCTQEALPHEYLEVDLIAGNGVELLNFSLEKYELLPEAQFAFALVDDSSTWQSGLEALQLNYLRNEVVQK